MRFLTLLLLAGGALLAGAPTEAALEKRLDELARIGSVMVDGDVCQRIVTARAKLYLLKKDPRDEWIGSDNYDVHPEAFNLTKKTLMRLARLVDFPCDVNLWMPREDNPAQIQVIIRNINEMSQFWNFGDLYVTTPPEMKRVLETGERVLVKRRPGIVSVLAPVTNSLGDRVGLIEVVGRARADAHENVQ
jgi:hypothetical protein